MNKSLNFNLLKRLLPKILLTIIIGAIAVPNKVEAATNYTYANSKSHSFNGNASIDQSNDNRATIKWELTLKNGTKKTYSSADSSNSVHHPAAYTKHTCNSSCTTQVKSGGHYTSHSHTGSCGKWSQDGLSGYTCGGYPKNAGWVDDYVTQYTSYHGTLNSDLSTEYYAVAYTSSVSIEPFYGMDGSTLRMYVGNTEYATYNISAPDSLFTPQITSDLNSIYTIKQGKAMEMLMSGDNIETYQWQISTDNSTWRDITNTDTQFSGLGTRKLTLTASDLTYKDTYIRVICTNSMVSDQAVSSTRLNYDISTFTPNLSNAG